MRANSIDELADVDGLQIREARFDSGRRLQLTTLKIDLIERTQVPVDRLLLPPLSAENRLRTPQNRIEK